MPAPKAADRRSVSFSVALRSAKERRRIMLVVVTGSEAASRYDVSLSAAK
jgi:hypothetical protein